MLYSSSFIPLDVKPLEVPTPQAIEGIVLDENGLKSFIYNDTKYERGRMGGWSPTKCTKMDSFIVNDLGLSGMNKMHAGLQVRKDVIFRAKENWDKVIANPSNPLKDPHGFYIHFGLAKVGDKLRPWLEHRDSNDEVISLLQNTLTFALKQ